MAAAFLAGVTLIGYFFFHTERDAPYRAADPGLAPCNAAAGAAAWTILAHKEVTNDERNAIANFPNDGWEAKFRCAIQRHAIPPESGTGNGLAYTLAFVEFKEEGGGYELRDANGGEFSFAALRARVDANTHEEIAPLTQTRALAQHLRAVTQRGKVNYVVAWVHGWRHNASIGDGNVADLKVYAAHAARFLADRCRETSEKRYCDAEVTAVYFGWRGARLDEHAVRRFFAAPAEWIGAALGCDRAARDAGSLRCFADFAHKVSFVINETAAAITLFDRKPVSEEIAPDVRTALRSIEAALGNPGDTDLAREPSRHKLIVFGHSLGGNLLISATKDEMIKQVRRHVAGRYFDPPIGNLVVLINPAAEAAKWTSIQRPIYEKMIFRSIEGSQADVDAGHAFFIPEQRPAIVAVTAARTWPSGGVRDEDCAFTHGAKGVELASMIEWADSKRRQGVRYDRATHDLFPMFRFDFRPMADFFENLAYEANDPGHTQRTCRDRRSDRGDNSFVAAMAFQIARMMHDFPFQNTDIEQTRTIGHLDPPRYVRGALSENFLSARPYGTTHEIRLSANAEGRGATAVDYDRVASDEDAYCPLSHEWLTRARERPGIANQGANWDSDRLAPPTPGSGATLRARITHGYALSGINPITRPNDPFWNVRAVDDVIATHSGYMRSVFICAMNQLVMDEPTRWSGAKSPGAKLED